MLALAAASCFIVYIYYIEKLDAFKLDRARLTIQNIFVKACSANVHQLKRVQLKEKNKIKNKTIHKKHIILIIKQLIFGKIKLFSSTSSSIIFSQI